MTNPMEDPKGDLVRFPDGKKLQGNEPNELNKLAQDFNETEMGGMEDLVIPEGGESDVEHNPQDIAEEAAAYLESLENAADAMKYLAQVRKEEEIEKERVAAAMLYLQATEKSFKRLVASLKSEQKRSKVQQLERDIKVAMPESGTSEAAAM